MPWTLAHHVSRRSLALILGEACLIAGAVVLGIWIRLGNDTWRVLDIEDGYLKTAVIAVICLLCLYFADLYNLRRVADRREMFVRLMQGLGAASIVLALAVLLVPAADDRSRRVPRDQRPRHRGHERLARRVRVARPPPQAARAAAAGGHRPGRGDAGARAVRAASRARRRDRRVHRPRSRAESAAPVLNPGVIGTIEDIPSIARARAVDRVVVSLADARGKLPMDKLLEMKLDGVTFDHLASVYEEYTGKIAVENLRPSWLIFSAGFRKRPVVQALPSARSTSSLRICRARGCAAGDAAHGGLAVRADVARSESSTTSSVSASTAACSPSTSSDRCARMPRRTPAPSGLPANDRAHHASRPVPAPHPARRTAAALERAGGRHEPRRPAARAPGVRAAAHANRFPSTASATSSGRA